ncbi:MAG: hypothetical protein QOE35_2033 [Actinomycetota bacterium]
MRLHLLRPPPPTPLERLIGRRRARMVRRRVGFLALGVGVTLLRPKPRLRGARTLVVLGALVLFAAVSGVALPLH